jgi:hypothetical protein
MFHYKVIKDELLRHGHLDLKEMVKLGPLEWDMIANRVLMTPCAAGDGGCLWVNPSTK